MHSFPSTNRIKTSTLQAAPVRCCAHKWQNDTLNVYSVSYSGIKNNSKLLGGVPFKCVMPYCSRNLLENLWVPCCIEHRCARQCFQKHSGRQNLPRRRAGAPDAGSCRADRPERGGTGRKIRSDVETVVMTYKRAQPKDLRSGSESRRSKPERFYSQHHVNTSREERDPRNTHIRPNTHTQSPRNLMQLQLFVRHNDHDLHTFHYCLKNLYVHPHVPGLFAFQN